MNQTYYVKKALKEQKSIKMSGNLYSLTQVEFAYNSNHMEGSRLTKEQTRMLYETKTISSNQHEAIRFDDIIETNNHFRLLDYVIDHCDEDLDIPMMHKFHEILKMGSTDSTLEWFTVGKFKRLANIIGNHLETTPPEKVEEEIIALLQWYQAKKTITFDDIIEFHYRFERIHPYQDGNGRVGRMIMFKECLKNDIVPFIVEDIHKQFYYRGLQNYKEDKIFLIDTCLNSQNHYKTYYEKMIGNLYEDESKDE